MKEEKYSTESQPITDEFFKQKQSNTSETLKLLGIEQPDEDLEHENTEENDFPEQKESDDETLELSEEDNEEQRDKKKNKFKRNSAERRIRKLAEERDQALREAAQYAELYQQSQYEAQTSKEYGQQAFEANIQQNIKLAKKELKEAIERGDDDLQTELINQLSSFNAELVAAKQSQYREPPRQEYRTNYQKNHYQEPQPETYDVDSDALEDLLNAKPYLDRDSRHFDNKRYKAAVNLERMLVEQYQDEDRLDEVNQASFFKDLSNMIDRHFGESKKPRQNNQPLREQYSHMPVNRQSNNSNSVRNTRTIELTSQEKEIARAFPYQNKPDGTPMTEEDKFGLYEAMKKRYQKEKLLNKKR